MKRYIIKSRTSKVHNIGYDSDKKKSFEYQSPIIIDGEDYDVSFYRCFDSKNEATNAYKILCGFMTNDTTEILFIEEESFKNAPSIDKTIHKFFMSSDSENQENIDKIIKGMEF